MIVRTAALLLSGLLFATGAHAFTIHGTVTNGTTGATGVNATITVVKPSGGMEVVATIETTDGRFEIKDLDNTAPIYLLRTDYAGVMYNTPVTVTGQDQTVEIEVFEATTSWAGVKVVVPHLAATRIGNRLHIEQLYEITNDNTPQRAVVVKDGAFRLYLPADMDSLTDCFVVALGVPVQRTPIPTGATDVYSIDYPIRPGATRIGVSYTVPYPSGSYTLKEKVLHDIAHVTVFAVDSTMAVTSPSHKFEAQESVHGMTAFSFHELAANSEFVLTFAGGDPNFAGLDVEGDGHTGHENITVAMGDDEKMSWFLMATVLLVLTGIIGMSLRDRSDPLSDPKVLRAHYSMLLSRLARLDDLHAAQAVPADAYRESREDLMSRLAALAMQLRAHGGVHAPDGSETPAQSKVQ